MSDTQRNFLIIALVALLAVLFPVIGGGVFTLQLLLNIAFMVMIVAALVIAYRTRSGTIALMPAVPRLVLQGAGVVLLVVIITGGLPIPVEPFGWGMRGGSSTYLFWGSIIGCAAAMFWAWGQRTTGW